MSITEHDLNEARVAWGESLIAMSKAYEADGIDGARAVAGRLLDDGYDFESGPVLFKPTMANGEQTFRTTRQGALSYFVAHDDEYPNDGGFGLRGWRQVETETAASFIDGDVAMWMGWVTMTDRDGGVTTVDKSWGYRKDADGVVRIVLHHSSLAVRLLTEATRTRPQSRAAASTAKYVSTPAAPARLNAIRLSSMTRSRSSQPCAAAPASIAYSPLTW